MDMIRFKLLRVEKEENEKLDASKLLGSPVFPMDFLEGKIDSDLFFVAQLNCTEIPSLPPFPNKGYLYFFVDIATLKPKVLYTPNDPEELIEDINDAFDIEDFGDPTCLRMVFDEKEKEKIPSSESSLFGEVDPNIGLEGYTDTEGKLTLLQIDAFSLPEEHRPLIFGNFGLTDGYWVFLIKEEDLRKGDYRRVELIEVGY